ncbi:MAG: UbiA-like protein EboC [Bacteroidota bacterium]
MAQSSAHRSARNIRHQYDPPRADARSGKCPFHSQPVATSLLNKNIRGLLRLARPANLFTAMADVLLGFAASGFVLPDADWYGGYFHLTNFHTLLLLIVASVFLYTGGVVFNDVFDADIDSKERPERPIPSGDISKASAAIFGGLLFLIGCFAAIAVSVTTLKFAGLIIASSLLYNGWGKHHFIGPINMGLCRGLNLLLGMSASPSYMQHGWMIILIPTVFIAAVTMISRGEVHGGSTTILNASTALYILVLAGCLSFGFMPGFQLPLSVPFLFLFSCLIFPPIFKARVDRTPFRIQAVVRACVLSLIVLDAALAAGFAGWGYGLCVLCLLPISTYTAKYFAVT